MADKPIGEMQIRLTERDDGTVSVDLDGRFVGGVRERDQPSQWEIVPAPAPVGSSPPLPIAGEHVSFKPESKGDALMCAALRLAMTHKQRSLRP